MSIESKNEMRMSFSKTNFFLRKKLSKLLALPEEPKTSKIRRFKVKKIILMNNDQFIYFLIFVMIQIMKTFFLIFSKRTKMKN